MHSAPRVPQTLARSPPIDEAMQCKILELAHGAAAADSRPIPSSGAALLIWFAGGSSSSSSRPSSSCSSAIRGV